MHAYSVLRVRVVFFFISAPSLKNCRSLRSDWDRKLVFPSDEFSWYIWCRFYSLCSWSLVQHAFPAWSSLITSCSYIATSLKQTFISAVVSRTYSTMCSLLPKNQDSWLTSILFKHFVVKMDLQCLFPACCCQVLSDTLLLTWWNYCIVASCRQVLATTLLRAPINLQ